MGMMGGGMGGGMGGMGGGMGGMGGGMGGMGGGMMGGMGMMNIADDTVVAQADADEFNNDTIKNRKKKAEIRH
jgi:hypothetical protein